MKLLENKWALVTGSSRGIGQQIAWGLAELGCNLIVHGREPQNLEKTLAGLEKFGVQTHIATGELSTPDGVQQVIEQAMAAPGPVDILYNNAAVQAKYQSIFEVDQAEWDRVFQINVWALIKLCQAFASGMRERGYGRIINLTSGIADQPSLAAYSVSKAAVDKFSRDLAAEFKGENILVNYLDPGWLQTDLGGPNAPGQVESVLPGALVPALLKEGNSSGMFYGAQDYKDKKLADLI
ncbi:MAG TPA: NAD(P)-dependent oxidoreductase [Chloroflexi bacterium]|nr:NAD(P)-dependent oxidoreductase [Chloroflexota bacterium]